MEHLFLLLIVISIIWSVLKKLREASKQQAAGQTGTEAKERRAPFGEMLRRELERQRREAAGEFEAAEPPAPAEMELVEAGPEPVREPASAAAWAEKRVMTRPEPVPEHPATKPVLVLPLDRDSGRRGIVLSEILGPCRAVRPHGF
jgi:hypothetical protein